MDLEKRLRQSNDELGAGRRNYGMLSAMSQPTPAVGSAPIQPNRLGLPGGIQMNGNRFAALKTKEVRVKGASGGEITVQAAIDARGQVTEQAKYDAVRAKDKNFIPVLDGKKGETFKNISGAEIKMQKGADVKLSGTTANVALTGAPAAVRAFDANLKDVTAVGQITLNAGNTAANLHTAQATPVNGHGIKVSGFTLDRQHSHLTGPSKVAEQPTPHNRVLRRLEPSLG